MGLMPKLMGISYFNASEKGAREAAAELGVDLDFDGPAVDSAEEQVKMIDRWIAFAAARFLGSAAGRRDEVRFDLRLTRQLPESAPQRLRSLRDTNARRSPRSRP